MTLPFTVRPFTPDDYGAMSVVMNTAFPEYPETPDELRHSDEYRAPGLHRARWVAVAEGQVVGYCHYTQDYPMYHPRKFQIDAIVLPAYRGRGIGKALYETLLAQATSLDPIGFRTHARETEERAVRFLSDRGFQEVQREQESLLALSNFQPDCWQEAIVRARQENIRLVAYADLLATRSPDALHRQLDDLHWQVSQDIPSSEPPQRPPHEQFAKRFARPDFVPDGNFFALDGETLVGESILWKPEAGTELWTGTTGVLRSHRKRGIATALKVKALTWAKASGATGVRTTNEVGNLGMLGINNRLGFVPQPAWIEYRKELAPDNEETHD